MDKNCTEKIVYYTDELNDEFSPAVISPKKIDQNWIYIHTGIFKRFTHFFWYRIIATPAAWLYLKIRFSHKIVGKKKVKGMKGTGYFLFGNHTQPTADAFIPTMISYPKDVYVIVHPNNVSMPFLGRITPSLGALPLPDDLAASKSFISAVKKRVSDGNAVCIYPEAHIWPYYTGIRNFRDDSFRYPVRYNKPVFCFTNTYQKKGRRVKIVTYVDGPFYPDSRLSVSDSKKQLRDMVYNVMKQRCENSNIQVIKYIRREEGND